ncbi:hypothetical protein H0H87_007906 [Tephrocybe sp. NHM501043]|nr:hypothetical protein H0H87_007906 [Tephrocybe sp. NHM501043]
MSNSSPWEEAWNSAQPRLSAIRDAFNTSTSPDPRVIRVGQLDSELLDQELVQVLQEPLNKALSLVNASIKARFEPELALLLQLTLYKLSIWNTGASYGAKLQDLRYTVSRASGKTLARPAGTPDGTTTRSQKRGKYWSLPQDQCAICAENASLNLNISEPSNAFTTLTSAPIGQSSLGSDSEPPAYPIYNPYLASCGDIYCYHCIAERLIQTADSGEDDDGWACLRCNAHVKNADRYTVEMGSDATGSDYEFTSISGSVSMGSYSESGWSDSSAS